MYVFMRVCMCSCVYVFVSVCVRACVYECSRILIYIYIYTIIPTLNINNTISFI